ncbi:MAG: hypothetical protein ACR2F8_01000 [Caulobacteraceae bacterium]
MKIESTGRWNFPSGDVGVRPFPFPFVAGFALANENTYASADLFEEAHAFVSGRGATPYGEGLGLEVGDSVVAGPDGAPGLAAGGEGPADAARLDELAQAGWLDCLFCPEAAARPAMTRAFASWPPAWRPIVFLGSTSPAETAVLAGAGVRFFGDDGLVEIDKFGDHLDYRTIERFALAAREYDWSRWGRPPSSMDAGAEILAGFMNLTLQVRESSRGRHWGFKRYGGPWRPSMPTFSGQVTGVLLDQLTNLAGAVIVQQRFGLWSLVGAAPDRDEARANSSPALDRHAVAAWRDIAERAAAGQLWVVTAGRLLDHLWRRQSLKFTVDKSHERWVVRLEGLICPILGDRAIEPGDLNGLSFTVPEGAPEVIVIVGGDRDPLAMRRATDSAYRGRDAVYRPWAFLEWPEANGRQHPETDDPGP